MRTALLSGLLATTALAQNGPRPNVLIVLADDLGSGDLGAYNAYSKIRTPNLDALARQSTRFTDLHSPSAVCTPTRYGLLTGRYAWRTRLKRWTFNGYGTALIEPERPTLASFFKSQGYATACFGKWHLGLQDGDKTDYSLPLTPGPNSVGFDQFFGIPASLDFPPYVFVRNETCEAPPSLTIKKSAHRRQGGVGFWRAGPIAAGFRHEDVLERIADQAISWLEDRKRRHPDQPFFLYVPLSAPHTPWLPTPEFIGRGDAGHYGAFVAMVDHAVGRIDRALHRLDYADQTITVFSSDNGSHWLPADVEKYGHQANLHYRGQKADIHEGGHRVPMLVRWPGHTPADREEAELLCLVDWFATLADLLGVRIPEGGAPDSFSFAHLLHGVQRDATVRDHLVHHSGHGMFALRRGPWKLIEGRGSGGFTKPARIKPEDLGPGEPRGQLYDLSADPGEHVNQWAMKPAIVAELQAVLDRVRAAGRSRGAR